MSLSKRLSRFIETNSGNQLVPVDLADVPEPDDSEIDKMILGKEERALKKRLWNELNKDWIKQKRKEKEDEKARRKTNQTLSSMQPSMQSQSSMRSEGPGSPTGSHANISVQDSALNQEQ